MTQLSLKIATMNFIVWKASAIEFVSTLHSFSRAFHLNDFVNLDQKYNAPLKSVENKRFIKPCITGAEYQRLIKCEPNSQFLECDLYLLDENFKIEFPENWHKILISPGSE